MEADLIAKIVAEVMKALKAQGAAPAAPSAEAKPAAKPAAATIPFWKQPVPQPPKTTGFGMGPMTFKPVKNAPPSRNGWKIFVTAEMLGQRMASAEGNVIEIAANEVLTPAAEDLAEKRHLIVRKQVGGRLPQPPLTGQPSLTPQPPLTAPQSVSGGCGNRPVASPLTHAIAAASGLGVVTSGGTDKVVGALAAIRRDGIELAQYNQTDCWMRNTLALANAINAGAVAGGILLLPHGADALLLTNKIRGIRAVQGTQPDAVAAAVRRFDANVLVIEHAVATYHEIRTMVRLFTAPRQAPAYQALLEHVASLEGR